MILTTVQNQVKFKYVLMDMWFEAKENFEFITKHKIWYIVNSLLMEIPFQQFMKKDGKLKNFLSHLSTM